VATQTATELTPPTHTSDLNSIGSEVGSDHIPIVDDESSNFLYNDSVLVSIRKASSNRGGSWDKLDTLNPSIWEHQSTYLPL
jgi:hypothetical protein